MSSTLHFFSIPALGGRAEQDALNAFVAQQRVVALDKHWLDAGLDSCWAVCVTVAAGPGPLPATLKLAGSKGGRAEKIDYREVLDPDDFAVFAALRGLRQQLSGQDGVPPYALFTNEQLAVMARQRPTSADALRTIDGVGEARVSKYGAAFLAVVQTSQRPAGNS